MSISSAAKWPKGQNKETKSHTPRKFPNVWAEALAVPPLSILQGEETNTDTASVRDYRKQSPYNPNSMQHRRCCIKGTHGHRPRPKSGDESPWALEAQGQRAVSSISGYSETGTTRGRKHPKIPQGVVSVLSRGTIASTIVIILKPIHRKRCPWVHKVFKDHQARAAKHGRKHKYPTYQ